jgi:glucokinase
MANSFLSRIWRSPFSDALAAFMTPQTDLSLIRHALLGVAGVAEGERCALTNNPWVVAASELCRRFGLLDVHIVKRSPGCCPAFPPAICE